MSGGGVCSMLLLLLVTRCVCMVHVCFYGCCRLPYESYGRN